MSDESYLCIDIGTSSIKALEKNASGKVLRWGILERDSLPFHSSIQPLDPKDVAEALRQLLDRMGATAGSVVFSLPSFYVFTAVSDVVNPGLIPAVPGAYKLEVSKLNDGRYFLVATPKEILEKYQEICQLTGLRLIRLELESFAIARRFSQDPARTLVVDIGKRSTTFTVIASGAVEYLFHSDFAGASGALDGVPYITSYVWDVIMNKTREIAEKKSIRNILFSNSAFNIVNGLQKIPQQAFNGYSGRGSVRSAR